jgi:hypothetical protein
LLLRLCFLMLPPRLKSLGERYNPGTAKLALWNIDASAVAAPSGRLLLLLLLLLQCRLL